MKDIFLCYSRKDSQQALQLKTEIENLGYSIWLDKEDILPGQKWELNIRNAINDSRVVIVCLSSHWVSEKSFVHKELKTALEVMDLFPEDHAFIIPVKLDDCDIPDKLKDLQYVEISQRGYLDQLQQALEKAIGNRTGEDEKKKNLKN